MTQVCKPDGQLKGVLLKNSIFVTHLLLEGGQSL